MTRKDFQVLAEKRLKEAQVLYRNRLFDGAYYLCGYAVECALKACIAKKTQRYDFPDKELAFKVYTHDLNQLALAADLKDEFAKGSPMEPKWFVVKDWNERSRYRRYGKPEVKLIMEAVGGPQGVFACITKYW